jgi:tetratricopeptide (TPR) repeat protein
LYHYDNNLDEARNYYEAARVIHSEVGNKSLYGLSTATLGVIFKEEGQLEEARAAIMNALAIFEAIQYQACEGEFFGELAHVEMLSGQWEAAHHALSKAEALLRKVNNTLKLAHLLCYRGQYECHFGNKSAACATLTEARVHYQAFQKGTNAYSVNELALLEGMIAALPT